MCDHIEGKNAHFSFSPRKLHCRPNNWISFSLTTLIYLHTNVIKSKRQRRGTFIRDSGRPSYSGRGWPCLSRRSLGPYTWLTGSARCYRIEISHSHSFSIPTASSSSSFMSYVPRRDGWFILLSSNDECLCPRGVASTKYRNKIRRFSKSDFMRAEFWGNANRNPVRKFFGARKLPWSKDDFFSSLFHSN